MIGEIPFAIDRDVAHVECDPKGNRKLASQAQVLALAKAPGAARLANCPGCGADLASTASRAQHRVATVRLNIVDSGAFTCLPLRLCSSEGNEKRLVVMAAWRASAPEADPPASLSRDGAKRLYGRLADIVAAKARKGGAAADAEREERDVREAFEAFGLPLAPGVPGTRVLDRFEYYRKRAAVERHYLAEEDTCAWAEAGSPGPDAAFLRDYHRPSQRVMHVVCLVGDASSPANAVGATTSEVEAAAEVLAESVRCAIGFWRTPSRDAAWAALGVSSEVLATLRSGRADTPRVEQELLAASRRILVQKLSPGRPSPGSTGEVRAEVQNIVEDVCDYFRDRHEAAGRESESDHGEEQG